MQSVNQPVPQPLDLISHYKNKLRINPNDAETWLLLADLLSDPRQKKGCLKWAAKADPNYPGVRARLTALESTPISEDTQRKQIDHPAVKSVSSKVQDQSEETLSQTNAQGRGDLQANIPEWVFLLAGYREQQTTENNSLINTGTTVPGMQNSIRTEALTVPKSGGKQEAIRLYSQAILQDPSSLEAWLELADILEDPQRELECYKYVARLRKRNGNSPQLSEHKPPEIKSSTINSPRNRPEFVPSVNTTETALQFPPSRTDITAPSQKQSESVVSQTLEELISGPAPAWFHAMLSIPVPVSQPASVSSPTLELPNTPTFTRLDKYCTRCGEPNPQDYIFCNSCGSQFNAPQLESAQGKGAPSLSIDFLNQKPPEAAAITPPWYESEIAVGSRPNATKQPFPENIDDYSINENDMQGQLEIIEPKLSRISPPIRTVPPRPPTIELSDVPSFSHSNADLPVDHQQPQDFQIAEGELVDKNEQYIPSSTENGSDDQPSTRLESKVIKYTTTEILELLKKPEKLNLRGYDLSGVNLRGVSLEYVSLNRCNLRGADLSKANLLGASLIGADLSGANLTGADLRHTNLYEAILDSTNLSGVKYDFEQTVWPEGVIPDRAGARLSDGNLASFNPLTAGAKGTDSKVDARNADILRLVWIVVRSIWETVRLFLWFR